MNIAQELEEKLEISKSKYQTKDWRKDQDWYIDGKRNECEKYQFRLLKQITKCDINRTNDRIHCHKIEIISKSDPMNEVDGFEYTEDFDGLLIKNDIKYYFNLKFVCNSGGAQTRTLREVYHHINHMILYLLKYKTIKTKSNNKLQQSCYFINILDGDTSNKLIELFDYLYKKIDTKEVKFVKEHIFIGDMHKFERYWKNKQQVVPQVVPQVAQQPPAELEV